MIITRTPLRISIGGGGTDLHSYYSQYGGFVVSAAISQYVFVSLNRMFSVGYLLKYSSLERVKSVNEIVHPILREVLRRHDRRGSLEISSMADVPAGTGLGSSGTFTVGLLRALYAHKREFVSAATLAEAACEIEIDVLGQPLGKQDQYIAAFGGLSCFDLAENGSVTVTPLNISDDTLLDLEQNLLMFFTGYSRNATSVLSEQKDRSLKSDPEMIENLHSVKRLGLSAKQALETGNTKCFADLMREHWEIKRARSKDMSNSRIDHFYSVGMQNGALGGKLVGAGGGGFLLFYAEDPMRLRRAMAREALPELRFRFDHDGSTVLVRD